MFSRLAILALDFSGIKDSLYVSQNKNDSWFLEDLESINFAKEYRLSTYANAELFMTRIINFFLWFLAIVMLAAMIYAGYLIMTAMGNDEQAGKGRKILIGAILGFFVILSSYAIVMTILYSERLLAPRALDIFGGIVGTIVDIFK